MSIYGELNPEPEHRTQFAFKGKREHIVKVKIPNIGYPNQHIDVEISAGSRDQIIVPDTLKITFNLEVESKDKTCSVVNNVGRALVKKKVLMLGSKEIDRVNQSYICDTYDKVFSLQQVLKQESVLQKRMVQHLHLQKNKMQSRKQSVIDFQFHSTLIFLNTPLTLMVCVKILLQG